MKKYLIFIPKWLISIAAFWVYHDEYGKDEFKTKFLGAIFEGYSASNDNMGSFRVPIFNDAKFGFDKRLESINSIIIY